LVEAAFSDVRFAVRWLLKSPWFTFAAVASLAIGIGFNTALFTIVDAILFKPLPVEQPSRIVDVFTSSPFLTYGTSSYPDYLDFRARNDVFEDLLGYAPMFGALSREVGARLVMGEIVTGNYFQMLGVRAFVGRTLTPEDDAPGAAPVCVVSYRYWTRELGSAPDVAGRTISVRGDPLTIVGVAPSGFTGMVPVLAPELWIPVSTSLDVEPFGLHDAVPSPTGTSRLERRGERWMFLRGRLKPRESIDRARANLDLIMSRLASEYPATNRDRRIAVKATSQVHIHPALDPRITSISHLLLAGVALVLVVACLNVASMLLARASSRRREIGVRIAIGASRGRLVRQLVTESIVLSFFGAIAGTLLAQWIITIVASISLPTPIPFAFNLRIDGRVLAFTLIATLVAGLLAGLAPSIQSSRPGITGGLRGEEAATRVAGWRWTFRDVLVAGQMAVTFILLVVAALLTHSLLAEQRVDPGFPAGRLAIVSFDAGQLSNSREQTDQFYEAVLARVRDIPGVESVALTTRPVFSPNPNRWTIWVPGRHESGQPGDTVEVTTVSPDYFQTMAVPIVAGRGFTNADGPFTPRVAIVNETMARKLWPGQNALGQTFRSRRDGPLIQIVGISADHKVTSIDEAPTPFLHLLRGQQPNPYSAVIARTRGDASALLRDMRREIHAIAPTLVFVENQTMEAEVAATLFGVRAGAWLVGAIGGIAMLLAAVGLYGVIAYTVTRRTREIGIRIALGARRSTVLRLVMRKGLVVALTGLAAGAVLAAIAAQQVSPALYGVGPGDLASWLVAALTIVGVAALANLIPAWRAALVHPSAALRDE
jgi:predicted permease